MLLTVMFQLTVSAMSSKLRLAVPVPSRSPEPAGTSFKPLSGTTKLMIAASAWAAPSQVDSTATAASRSVDFTVPPRPEEEVGDLNGLVAGFGGKPRSRKVKK